jgi:ACS family hexuronate transporter-like MFS transporter
MNTLGKINDKMTNYRWTICILLFLATTINYLDRQVLSLLQPILADEFHWTDSDYGTITSIFSLAYAVSMLFAGSFVDKMGTRKGYAWALGVWSVAAMLHALCGLGTEWWTGIPDAKSLTLATGTIVSTISIVSVSMFVLARIFLAFGESANFPAAIKATAEYFPKRDRAYATGIFNSGANVGAILAPLTVPFMAKAWGWETAFLIVGAIGFLWIIAWLIFYKPIEKNKKVNAAERAYINQDDEKDKVVADATIKVKKMTFKQAIKFKQTWAFAFGKFMTDGVWWFFLFWTPAYLKAEYGMSPQQIAIPIGVLYTITVFGSVFGGKFPTFFINRGMNPYAGRMRAMMIIAFFPLLVLMAQPLGHLGIMGHSGFWIPVLLIGIGGSAHQAWSANIFTTVGDMFPKSAVATIVGIGGMAGGIGSFLINKGSGLLFDYSLHEWGSKSTGYSIVFSFCAVAYLIGWIVMKVLVPKYKPIITE